MEDNYEFASHAKTKNSDIISNHYQSSGLHPLVVNKRRIWVKKGNFWKAAVISTKEIEHKNIKKRAENENEQKNWENKYKNEKLLTDSICPLSPVSMARVSPAVTMTSLCCTLFIVSVRFRFKLQCLLSTDKSLHIL